LLLLQSLLLLVVSCSTSECQLADQVRPDPYRSQRTVLELNWNVLHGPIHKTQRIVIEETNKDCRMRELAWRARRQWRRLMSGCTSQRCVAVLYTRTQPLGVHLTCTV